MRDPFADDLTGNGPTPAPDDSDPPEKQRSFLAELPILVLVALVVAVLIKTFLVQAFWIPSGSMIPTLEINDRVMVNKLAYVIGEPQRGDIVVFDSPFAVDPVNESVPTKVRRTILESLGVSTAAVPDDLIKRVIGLPGETLEIRNNHVLIDGEPIDEPYLEPSTNMADYPPVTLRADEVFMMGDNRNNSSDSRRFNAVSLEHVVGKAFVRIWPADRWSGL